ncbi:hypothetical protein [Salipiger marinus]|uniref:hypothetical protein n=1 Tax=Salipiger marinus TaxID=555512 RepID=UPI0040592030
MALLRLCARHARWLLVAGLVLGIALPDLTRAVRPWLPELVALMLFVAALRIGPKAALGALATLPRTLAVVLVFQLAAPLAVLGLCIALGVADSPVALALVLLCAAAPLAGSPNLALLVGGDPAPALRLLILGTALLPLTALPVLALMPDLGDPALLRAAVLRLLATIAGATALAFGLRALLPEPALRQVQALDGASALVMTVLVLGLMSAIAPALRDDPLALLAWLALAFAANLGPQLLVGDLLARRGARDGLHATALIAGNRNIALFLVALPPEVTAKLLLFIGCYQIPMYLTPLLLPRLYSRFDARASIPRPVR